MTIKPAIIFRERQYTVDISSYTANDNTCIVLLSLEGQVEMYCTSNLSVKLPPHQFYIKDYSGNRGIAAALLQAKIMTKVAGAPPRPSGHVQFDLYEFTPETAEIFGVPHPGPVNVVEPEEPVNVPIEDLLEGDAESPRHLEEPDLVEGLVASGFEVVHDSEDIVVLTGSREQGSETEPEPEPPTAA